MLPEGCHTILLGDLLVTPMYCHILVSIRPQKVIAWRPWDNVDTTLHSHYRVTTKNDRMVTLRQRRCNTVFLLPYDYKKRSHGNLEATSMQHHNLVTVWPQKVIAWRPWGNIDAIPHSCYRTTIKSDRMVTMGQHRCNVAFSLPCDHKKLSHGGLQISTQCRILVTVRHKKWLHGDLEKTSIQRRILVTVRSQKVVGWFFGVISGTLVQWPWIIKIVNAFKTPEVYTNC